MDLIIKIHNTETNEIIEREMNSEEVKQFEADKERIEQERQDYADKIVAKKTLLDKLGITEDEAKLLLS